MHNQTYSGTIRAHSGIFRPLRNLGIFRDLSYSKPEAYSEPWYIQNPRMFRTLVYSEPWSIQNPTKHLRWSVLRKWLTAIINFAISVFQDVYFDVKEFEA